MPNCISILKAATLKLGSLRQPVITKYQLGKLIFDLHIEGSYQGQPLCTRKEIPIQNDFSRVLKELLDTAILNENPNFPTRSVFNILGKEPKSPGEIACIVDPFAYVSHLSAMEYHGLTDRFPKILYITSLSSNEWSMTAIEKMDKDFTVYRNDYRDSGFPKLQRIKIGKISGMNVQLTKAKTYLGAYAVVQDSALRISTIGRTFFDMLRNPADCGGIRHVIDVYKNNAHIYIKAIVEEIERHGGPIDKVRAGYILDEICELSDPKINNWLEYVQRGGSRKLVANASYSPIFSDKWCISLNLEEV